MRDYLMDIVTHLVPFSVFNTLRVEESDGQVEVSSTEASNREIVIQGKLHSSPKDFKGLFGIPNLTLLSTLLNIPEYQDDKAKISMSYEGEGANSYPANFHFENASGDFVNDFRVMKAGIIDKVEPKLTFKINKWAVEFVPTTSAHQRLKYQASVNPGEKIVTFKIENGEVSAVIGDASSHNGRFVFQNGIDPKAKKTILAPVLHVITALSLNGDKKIHMDDAGMMITVNSGLAEYNFIIPSLSK